MYGQTEATARLSCLPRLLGPSRLNWPGIRCRGARRWQVRSDVQPGEGGNHRARRQLGPGYWQDPHLRPRERRRRAAHWRPGNRGRRRIHSSSTARATSSSPWLPLSSQKWICIMELPSGRSDIVGEPDLGVARRSAYVTWRRGDPVQGRPRPLTARWQAHGAAISQHLKPADELAGQGDETPRRLTSPAEPGLDMQQINDYCADPVRVASSAGVTIAVFSPRRRASSARHDKYIPDDQEALRPVVRGVTRGQKGRESRRLARAIREACSDWHPPRVVFQDGEIPSAGSGGGLRYVVGCLSRCHLPREIVPRSSCEPAKSEIDSWQASGPGSVHRGLRRLRFFRVLPNAREVPDMCWRPSFSAAQ